MHRHQSSLEHTMNTATKIRKNLAQIASRTLLMSHIVFSIGFGARLSVPLYIDHVLSEGFYYPAIMAFPCGMASGLAALLALMPISMSIDLLPGPAQAISSILFGSAVAGAVFAGGYLQWFVWVGRAWANRFEAEDSISRALQILSFFKSAIQLLFAFKLFIFAAGFVQTLLHVALRP
jgi:hypothetical protein